jgi:hypothetical protein
MPLRTHFPVKHLSSVMRPSRLLKCAAVAAACMLVCAMAVQAENEYSVKIVKTAAGRSTAAPQLHFLADGDGWRVTKKPWHSGENDWEVYFELENDGTSPALPEVEIVAPGVKVARAISGKTDVKFTQEGNAVRFRLAQDRSLGQQFRIHYQSPRGGYPIDIDHNWKMRRTWQYLADPYPAKQVAAVPNYLLAAQEVLREMGDMGPKEPKAWGGQLVLMASEITASRGHMDWPQHVHIMHYEHGKNAAGELDYTSRIVPHFYMDDDARIVRNDCASLVGQVKSGKYAVGDACHFEDAEGRPVIDFIIRDFGLVLRRTDGAEWSLRPDPEQGAAHAVWGWRGDQPVCRAEAHDDAQKGEFRYELDIIADGKTVETFRDGYRYDPFTAKVVGKL